MILSCTESKSEPPLLSQSTLYHYSSHRHSCTRNRPNISSFSLSYGYLLSCRRIADATGIPVHPDEDLLSFARIRSRDNNIRHGNYPPFGLHHESDTRPNRARTVLIYLEAPHHGGRTVSIRVQCSTRYALGCALGCALVLVTPTQSQHEAPLHKSPSHCFSLCVSHSLVPDIPFVWTAVVGRGNDRTAKVVRKRTGATVGRKVDGVRSACRD